MNQTRMRNGWSDFSFRKLPDKLISETQRENKKNWRKTLMQTEAFKTGLVESRRRNVSKSVITYTQNTPHKNRAAGAKNTLHQGK